jgi:hypothetical protein
MRILSNIIPILFLSLILASCEPSYAEKREMIAREERMNPSNFLTASGTYRETLFGNKMKISGYVVSRAQVAGFTNIRIKVRYISDEDVELSHGFYTLNEFIAPGSVVNFEWKIDRPPHCRKLGWEVVGAVSH